MQKRAAGKNGLALKRLTVRRKPGSATRGLLKAGCRVLPCALGRSGIKSIKREGDGATPHGRFAVLAVHMRRDCWSARSHRLPLTFITPDKGWCDAVGDRNYNRPVPLPYPASHEKLQREDHLYDIFFDLDHNRRHRLTRGGSAIFFHLAREDYGPTEGCVAISGAHMRWLAPRIGPDTVMVIL